MRILLVEDDEALCRAMAHHLEAEGYEVDCCQDGDDALRWLDQEAHGLVILDRMLPGADGITVRSLSRRPAGWESAPRLQWGDLQLDPQRHLAQCGEKSVSLSKRESQLLETLLRNPKAVLPRTVIFARVWGPDAPVEESNLDSYVHFLRKRLKEIGSSVRIKTVRSVGYRLQSEEDK